MWGHHITAHPLPLITATLSQSKFSLYSVLAKTALSTPNKRDLSSKPNLPTSQWQSRLTSSNLDKRRHLFKPIISHKGPRSESRGQPPAEVGDPSAQRVEERPVECYTRIPRSRRPIALEDDKTGDESFYHISPWSHRGDSLSQTLRKTKPVPTIWRLRFNRCPICRSRQLLRWLTWR